MSVPLEPGWSTLIWAVNPKAALGLILGQSCLPSAPSRSTLRDLAGVTPSIQLITALLSVDPTADPGTDSCPQTL